MINGEMITCMLRILILNYTNRFKSASFLMKGNQVKNKSHVIQAKCTDPMISMLVHWQTIKIAFYIYKVKYDYNNCDGFLGNHYL